MISLLQPVQKQNSELTASFPEKDFNSFTSKALPQLCLPIYSKKIQTKGKRYRKSCWTLSENLKYREFLLSNGHLLEASLENRRESQVNKMLSLHLKSRSPDQCRSHHQKMAARHRSIAGIVEYIDQLAQINLKKSKENEQRGNCFSKKLRIRQQKQRKDKVDQWIDCIWYSAPVNVPEPQTE